MIISMVRVFTVYEDTTDLSIKRPNNSDGYAVHVQLKKKGVVSHELIYWPSLSITPLYIILKCAFL